MHGPGQGLCFAGGSLRRDRFSRRSFHCGLNMEKKNMNEQSNTSESKSKLTVRSSNSVVPVVSTTSVVAASVVSDGGCVSVGDGVLVGAASVVSDRGAVLVAVVTCTSGVCVVGTESGIWVVSVGRGTGVVGGGSLKTVRVLDVVGMTKSQNNTHANS